MLLKLSAHVSDSLKRALAAEQSAKGTIDPAIRRDYELLAKSWRHLAASYQFVESLERFLSDSAQGNKDVQPPTPPAVVEEPSAVGDAFAPPETRPIVRRRRIKQTIAFRDRLLQSAQESRAQAALLPAGAAREGLLLKARQSETAANIDSWISSPLSPPQNDPDLGKKPKA